MGVPTACGSAACTRALMGVGFLALALALACALALPGAASAEGGTGSFVVTGGTQGADYDYAAATGTLTVKTDAPLTVSMSGPNATTEADAIVVKLDDAGKTADLTLAGVRIDASTTSNRAALLVEKGSLSLTLADGTSNSLKSGEDRAGLENGEHPLTIEGGDAGTGSLEATGGDYAAGIGGGWRVEGSGIRIEGGHVIAQGGKSAAGIGGGDDGEGSNIAVEGGDVDATGGRWAAGIGGGAGAPGSNIALEGGDVDATGGELAAGIGGGVNGMGTGIAVEGGRIEATAGSGGAAIGDGRPGDGTDPGTDGVTVTGGLFAEGVAHSGGSRGLVYGVEPEDGYAVRQSDGAYPYEVGGVAVGLFAPGGLFVTGGKQGADYDYDSGALTVETAAPLEVSMLDPGAGATDDVIVASVDAGEADLTLAGVRIDVSATSNRAALSVEQGSLSLTLADGSSNSLKSGRDRAGLENGERPLTIGGGDAGTGSLEAQGGDHAAGIGGGWDAPGSNIAIGGGDVAATGGYSAAGIGGGEGGEGSNIAIEGGHVAATGGDYAAGIGGGWDAPGSNIAIEGGDVAATGGDRAAGIGGAAAEGAGISVSGGHVDATGGVFAAGIGGGYNAPGAGISVTGGRIEATAGSGGAPIGDGEPAAGTAGTSGASLAGGLFADEVADDGTVYGVEPLDGHRAVANSGADAGDYPAAVGVVPALNVETPVCCVYDGEPLDAADLSVEAKRGADDAFGAVEYAYQAGSGWEGGLPALAGAYEVRVVLPEERVDGTLYVAEEETVGVTIAPKALTARVDGSSQSASKPYDGDAAFEDVALELAGVVDGDVGDVFATADGEADSAGAGEHGFKASDAELSGADAGNYALGASDVSGEVAILEAASAVGGAASYGEDGRPKASFTYGETISVRAAPELTGEPASAPAASALSLDAPKAGQMALFYEGAQVGDPADAGPDGSFTLSYDTSAKLVPLGSRALEARFVGDANVAGSRAEVRVVIAPRPLKASVDASSPSAARAYDGTRAFRGVGLALEGVLPDDEVSATADGAAAAAAAGPQAFEASFATLSGADAAWYALSASGVSGGVSVSRAPLVFRALDASMAVGGPLPEFAFEAEGLVPGDRVLEAPSLSVEGDLSVPGELAISIEGGRVGNQESYEVSYAPGTLIVSPAPAGADGPASPLPSGKALAPTGDAAAPLALAVLAAALALASTFAALAASRRTRRR